LDSYDEVDRQDNRRLGADGVMAGYDLSDEETIEFNRMGVFGWK
jgi:hypothetical protein